MNEEINTLLGIYQQRVNQLTAINISLEAKVQVLTSQINAKSASQKPKSTAKK